MAKNILQDIVPPEKRSIRNIPIPNKTPRPSVAPVVSDIKPAKNREEFFEMPKQPSRSKEMLDIQHAEDDDENETPHAYPYEHADARQGSRKNLIWGAIGVAIVIVALVVVSSFSGATVTVVPKSQQVSATSDTLFTATKDALDSELSFQVLKITKQEGISVPATGSENVEKKASGTIVIYNSTSASEQRLIKNTRFETPDGLIYRVNDSVVIPGMTSVSGKATPGSVEVTVYADEAGEKFNIGKTDFTIPGFKGDSRFETIIARSKTDMTGGFVGTVKKVSDADAVTAKKDLDIKLADELKNEAKSQIPSDFMMFEDGLFYSYASLPQSPGTDSSATINEEGTLNVIIFNKSLFAKNVAQKLAPSIAETDVSIMGAENLTFSIIDKDKLDVSNLTSITFGLDGTLRFLSQFDESKLKSDLANKKKSDLDSTLKQFPSIQSAQVVVRPFWKSTFPAQPEKIKIVITPESN